MPHRRHLLAVFVALLLFGGSRLTLAQETTSPRFGLGFTGVASTEESDAGVVGFGVRGRLSYPLNADLSFGAGAGLTGFILRGRDQASYLFDPQGSLIITLPGGSRNASYLLAGAGAYVPFASDEGLNGPTIHAGYGRVFLLSESTFFWEFDPAVIVGFNRIGLAVPLRVGVIF